MQCLQCDSQDVKLVESTLWCKEQEDDRFYYETESYQKRRPRIPYSGELT